MLEWDSYHCPCPYCGAMQSDLYEWFAHSSSESTDAECGSCGKAVTIYRRVSVDYAITEPEDAN